MTELPVGAEQVLAAMSAAEVTELLARVRPSVEQLDPLDQADAVLDGEPSPVEKAAAALRRSRGLDRPARATKAQAADAMRQYAAHARG